MRSLSAYSSHPMDDRGYEDLQNYLYINCVGYYEFDEAFKPTCRPHGRLDYYLSYNHYGNLIVKMNGEKLQIGEGQVFIYKPFEEQLYGQADSDMIENYWIHFTGFGVPSLFKALNLYEKSVFTIGTNYRLTVLFTDLINLLTEKEPYYETAAAALLMQIMVITAAAAESSLNSLHPATEELFHLSRQYIRRNYNKPIKISTLAELECLSGGGYYTQFKKAYGTSPQQYLIEYRLDKAIELMLNTNLNIRQIAYLSGFDDPLYFSRIFKKYKGLSPRQFGRQTKGHELP